jgi:hypothetical protein
MKTCAPATLAVVASSPSARNVNFIGEAFGSRRFNGRIRQQQRLRRRVVAELPSISKLATLTIPSHW